MIPAAKQRSAPASFFFFFLGTMRRNTEPCLIRLAESRRGGIPQKLRRAHSGHVFFFQKRLRRIQALFTVIRTQSLRCHFLEQR